MKTFRLIRSRPSFADYNMALDKAIFERYLEDGVPVFRVYGWSRPSFTYGISQEAAMQLDLDRCVRDGVGVSPRMTGGGVLFHNDEITYSFACGKDDIGEPHGVFVSYREICAFLLRFYGALGLKADFALNAQGFKNVSAAHPLCSASHEKFDIVINGRKIGGNAQKRKRQAVFQHGSVPRSVDWGIVSRYVKSLPEDISECSTDLARELAVCPQKDILEDYLVRAFQDAFGIEFIEEPECIYEACLA